MFCGVVYIWLEYSVSENVMFLVVVFRLLVELIMIWLMLVFLV